MNYQLILKTTNKKTGPIPVTHSPRATCPSVCPYKNDTCYVEAGYHTRINWDALDKGTRGGPWEDMIAGIHKFNAGTFWRHDVSGDLPHNDEEIDADSIFDLIDANQGKSGFTYTHHNMESVHNRTLVRYANKNGFAVNLSGNNLVHADWLKSLHIGPVVVTVKPDQTENMKTPAGHDVIICPATFRDDTTCATCKMCAVIDRKTIIGFPAHGCRKNKIKTD